jgi:thioredoxin
MDTQKKEKLPPSFFDLIRTSDVPVLVDFWAEWCGPCHKISPTIERLAREFSGKILTVKVNVDKRPNIAETFEVQSIPTVMLFWKGESRMRLTGAYPYEAVKHDLLENWPKDAAPPLP